MYAQMEKFVLASSTLETPCYAAPDLEAEELAELKSDLGSYYNALAKSLLGSSQMDSNKNPEESLKQGQHARKRAIEVVEEAVELKPGDANMRVKLAQVGIMRTNVTKSGPTERFAPDFGDIRKLMFTKFCDH